MSTRDLSTRDFREQREPKLRLKAPASVVADYFRLLVNRRAYTLQSNRPHPESGRHYYYRPTEKKTGQGLSLALDTIRRHPRRNHHRPLRNQPRHPMLQVGGHRRGL